MALAALCLVAVVRHAPGPTALAQEETIVDKINDQFMKRVTHEHGIGVPCLFLHAALVAAPACSSASSWRSRSAFQFAWCASCQARYPTASALCSEESP